MKAIKIDCAELQQVLKHTPPSQNVMLVGRHGIGKSQIVTSFFAKAGVDVVTFFLGQMSDPGDLIGLMHKDPKTGRSEFLPPYWWPKGKKPAVLFLDELNRARPEILQSVMDLTLNRTLAGKSLPEGSRVISAVNEGEEYQLTDLDPALVSRFNIYQFAPTIEDWLAWANKSGIDSRVTAFIQEHSEYLDGDPKAPDDQDFSTDLARTPDRRSWARVSEVICEIKQVRPAHTKILAGVVGINAAMKFIRSLKTKSTVSADDVLLRFAKSKAKLQKMSTPEFVSLNERLVLRIDKGGFTPATKKKVLKNFHGYVDLLLTKQESESCAHMASMLEKPKFETTSQFLLADAKILSQLVEFIEEISIS